MDLLLQDSYRVIGPQMGDITADIRAAMMRAAMQAYSSLFHLQASVCTCCVWHLCTCVLTGEPCVYMTPCGF